MALYLYLDDKFILLPYSFDNVLYGLNKIFIKINAGGKPLATENLALGYISIKESPLKEFKKIWKQVFILIRMSLLNVSLCHIFWTIL